MRSRPARLARLAMACLGAAGLAACTKTVSLDPPDGSVRDAAPSDAARADAGDPGAGIDRKCDIASAVDLLFVIDDSNSMAEEQNNLAMQLGQLELLARPEDRDGDGRPDYLPVRDLHVGVVTTDMGTAGYPVPTCSDSGDPDGDDGILLTRSGSPMPGCPASLPPFLAFDPRDDPPETLVDDAACRVLAGTGGCGFEQQLEAMLKALTPSSSTAVAPFLSGTGHADTDNAGFLRPDSLIVVVLLTDEDDCSVRDPELFDPTSTRLPGEALNLRCFQFGDEGLEVVHPVSRYVEGLRALRPGRPDLVFFAAITGVPPALVADPEHLDYDAVLAAPEMQELIDPEDPNRIRPSCNVPGLGIAFPPRRIVRTAQALAPHSIVQSICQADFGPVVAAIAREAGRRACLERAEDPPAP